MSESELRIEERVLRRLPKRLFKNRRWALCKLKGEHEWGDGVRQLAGTIPVRTCRLCSTVRVVSNGEA